MNFASQASLALPFGRRIVVPNFPSAASAVASAVASITVVGLTALSPVGARAEAGPSVGAPATAAGDDRASLTTASGKPNVNEFDLRTSGGCFNVEFTETPGSVISCTEWLQIKYRMRDCSTGDPIETGRVQASVSCEKNRLFHVAFRTSKGSVKAALRMKRVPDGRSGFITHYLVVDEGYVPDEPSVAHTLPPPDLLPRNEKQPEESPLVTKVSGFAYAEGEGLSNYGSTGTNFNRSGGRTGGSDITFLSNLAIDFSKDRSRLNALFEIGEVYYGEGRTPDANGASGGVQGSRGRIVEVRNLYVAHEPTEKISFKTGLLTVASDPRGWIFNDQIAAAQIDYHSDVSDGMVWFGKANSASNRNNGGFNSLNTAGKNYFAGFNGTIARAGAELKTGLFGLARFSNTQEWILPDGLNTPVTPTTNTYWIGGNLGYDFSERIKLELVGMGNYAMAESGAYKQRHSSYLADAKLGYTNEHSSFAVSVEGLMTPGASNAVAPGTAGDDRPVMGASRGFSSITDASYLMTLGTNDGLDDAVGAFRSSGMVAPLSQPEGLRIGVVTASMTFTKRTTGLLRGGVLRTEREVGTTGGKNLGHETDASVLHQLNPSTQLQLDVAALWPGDAQPVATRDRATIVAGKMKFSF